MVEEITIYCYEVEEFGVKICIVPAAIPDCQFIVLSIINEVLAAGFCRRNGEVEWKFGKPSEKIRREVENFIRKVCWKEE